METVTLWQWQVKQTTGRWRLLAWRMTEELAAAWMARQAKELRKVPGSAQVHQPERRTGGLMDRLGTLK
ncbi:MAG TPA: hypothetical protein VNT02_13930 [Burkholderiales bacterium]|jgi:hypothetical protein|nr:hypothetical protein [Burkholderiales bacterium]